MSEKGSKLRELHEKQELKRTLLEFTEKLETDPYQPGVVHPKICGDDIPEIVDDVLWIRDFSEMTIRIIKDPDGFTMSAEVTERKK